MATTSWLDALEGAGRTIAPSSLDAIRGMASGVLQSVAHPVRTAEAVGALGKGAYSKVKNNFLGGTDTPVARYKNEAALDTAWNNIANNYSKVDPKTGQRHFDEETFKNTLSTNPAQILVDASTFLPLAGEAGIVGRTGKALSALGDVGAAGDATSAALRVANAAKGAGSGLQTAGKVISKTGQLTNPLTAPLAVAQKVAPALSSIPLHAQSALTGVSPTVLKTAYAAGAAGKAPVLGSETAGNIFKRFASGAGSTDEIQQTATRALNAARQKASDAYMQGKAGLSTAPVDLKPALDALDKSDAKLGMGASEGFEDAKNAMAKARTWVTDVATNPKPSAQNIENVDALKRQLWDLKNSTPNAEAKNHIQSIYNGVKDSINNVDPDYGALMDRYQVDLQNTQDLVKTLGLSDKTANSAALKKQLNAAKNPAANDLLTQLSSHEPALPYMLAGQAARESMPGGFGKLAGAASSLGAAYAHSIPAAGATALGVLASSPKVSLTANHLLGKASAAGDVIPSLSATSAAANQYDRLNENRLQPQDEIGVTSGYSGKEALPTTDETPEKEPGNAFIPAGQLWGAPPVDTSDTPAPVARASGGAVKDIEHLVERLMKRAHNEKKHATKETEHFLKLPDTTVAKALAITKKAIA